MAPRVPAPSSSMSAVIIARPPSPFGSLDEPAGTVIVSATYGRVWRSRSQMVTPFFAVKTSAFGGTNAAPQRSPAWGRADREAEAAARPEPGAATRSATCGGASGPRRRRRARQRGGTRPWRACGATAQSYGASRLSSLARARTRSGRCARCLRRVWRDGHDAEDDPRVRQEHPRGGGLEVLRRWPSGSARGPSARSRGRPGSSGTSFRSEARAADALQARDEARLDAVLARGELLVGHLRRADSLELLVDGGLELVERARSAARRRRARSATRRPPTPARPRRSARASARRRAPGRGGSPCRSRGRCRADRARRPRARSASATARPSRSSAARPGR